MKSTATKSAHDQLGNRTGIQTSPDLAQELIEGTSNSLPSSEGDAEDLAEYRAVYIEEAFPIGSLPTLSSVEAAKASEEDIETAVLLDKLSERLAFERMGTRLYEALMNKCEILSEEENEPTLEQLKTIGDQELSHFLFLQRVVTELGGDPTVQSPSADVAAVASLGILQVLTDPRTSVTQCLQALLTAELTDNDGWQLLIRLADNLGYVELVTEFEAALESEQLHLDYVRSWLSARTLREAEV
jgi:bacterioferritin (cytochrome b1)